MNNKLIKIQEMLYNQMQRLDNNDLINKGLGKREFERSKTLSSSASTYIKTVQTQIKIKNIAKNNKKQEDRLLKELGIK